MTRTVVALGGNTLLRRGEGSVEAQERRIEDAAAAVASLHETGRELVLTHGNGPQVGNLLLQQAATDVAAQPLDVLVAETQAQIGYPLQRELDNRLPCDAVTVVTQVVVDETDPAFDAPTKPIGPYYTEAEAAAKPFETRRVRGGDETGRGDAPEGGDDRVYRRVVPSPAPVRVVESASVSSLLADGVVCIAGGGGGVPVVEGEDGFAGVEAVVDKDHTARVLGGDVDADELVVLTDVPAVYRDFGGDGQRPIRVATPAELRALLEAGEFGAGSMAPKVEACARFVEEGGGTALVTAPETLAAALEGDAGTRVRAAE